MGSSSFHLTGFLHHLHIPLLPHGQLLLFLHNSKHRRGSAFGECDCQRRINMLCLRISALMCPSVQCAVCIMPQEKARVRERRTHRGRFFIALWSIRKLSSNSNARFRDTANGEGKKNKSFYSISHFFWQAASNNCMQKHTLLIGSSMLSKERKVG